MGGWGGERDGEAGDELMTLTITYPATGRVRVYQMTQAQVNRMVSLVSKFQDTIGEVDVKIRVES